MQVEIVIGLLPAILPLKQQDCDKMIYNRPPIKAAP
jgi:hypothetical protein